jgi:hypothetical protein
MWGFAAMERQFAIMMLFLLICLPFGIWKIVDIIIWLIRHVSISVN